MTVRYNPGELKGPQYQIDCGVRRNEEGKWDVWVTSYAKDYRFVRMWNEIPSLVAQNLSSALGSDGVVSIVDDAKVLMGDDFKVWTRMRMDVGDTKEKTRALFYKCVASLEDVNQDMR